MQSKFKLLFRKDFTRRHRVHGGHGDKRTENRAKIADNNSFHFSLFTFHFSLLFILFFICGCTQIPGKLIIIEGNFYNSRGAYDKAITSYHRALEYTEARPYAEYGLGSVYYNLGETQASLSRYAEALTLLESQADGQQELRYRIHYNTGVALFIEGDFSGAADSFREALRVNGKKIEAKRNLELSLLSLERENNSGGGADSGESESKNESLAVLFEYILQKELGQWRNREWPEEETTGPDY